jgi:hypothetical protein
MKTDSFTKFLLFVIAINLTIHTLSQFDVIPKAYANSDSTSFNSPNHIKYGLVPLTEEGTISVSIDHVDEHTLFNTNLKYVGMERTDGSIEVDISDISTSETLPIDIAEISTMDDLEVDIDDISTSDDLNVWCRNCD